MKAKKCLLCGDVFVPTSGRQKYCNKPILKQCVVCGEDYFSKCALNVGFTCDKDECKRLAKTGVNNSLALQKCKRCGEEFKPKNSQQVYCGVEKSILLKLCKIFNLFIIFM